MGKHVLSLNCFRSFFGLFGNFIDWVFCYLSCNEDPAPDHLASLRSRIDSIRYQGGNYCGFSERKWQEDDDPENIENHTEIEGPV